MIDLTNETVVADLLKRAVDEKGADYVYPNANEDGEGCVYFDVKTGAPSCIVGHVLAYQGVTREDLIVAYDEDEESENLNEYTNVYDLARREFIKTSDETFEMLRNAQNAQDAGDTWGEAIDQAGVK